MEIRFKPIGVVHTKAGDDDVKQKGDQEGELEIFPEFAAWPVQKVMSEPNSEGSRSHCDAVLRKLTM